MAIFVHLLKQKLPSSMYPSPYCVQDIVSVTHVCRFWRYAAINTPELWTIIATMNVEMVKAFLERSGELPLSVDLRPGHGDVTETNYDTLDVLIPHTHRFREFAVHAPRELGRKVLDSFTEPAPLLERLVIRCQLEGQTNLFFDGWVPRLRELVVDFIDGILFRNHIGNLTSIHLTLPQSVLDLHPFFDVLRWCPLLEEMFLSGDAENERYALMEPQPTIPLHHLRKLRMSSIFLWDLGYIFRLLDLKPDGIAIHMSGIRASLRNRVFPVEDVFPDDNSDRPSLFSSTKLGLIFHTRPRTIIIDAVGPGFSIRMDLTPYPFEDVLEWVFQSDFPSVRELWLRGSYRMDTKIYGFRRFTGLEKLVLVGRGSKLAWNLRWAFSPDRSGVLPCPLLSTIYCHGSAREIREISLLARNRSSAGHRLTKLNVPTSFIPLPADTTSCVGEVGSFDIPPNILHLYAMELPSYCFVEGEHEWWQPWKSRL